MRLFIFQKEIYLFKILLTFRSLLEIIHQFFLYANNLSLKNKGYNLLVYVFVSYRKFLSEGEKHIFLIPLHFLNKESFKYLNEKLRGKRYLSFLELVFMA